MASQLVQDELARHPLALPEGAAYVDALRTADAARQDELDRRRTGG